MLELRNDKNANGHSPFRIHRRTIQRVGSHSLTAMLPSVGMGALLFRSSSKQPRIQSKMQMPFATSFRPGMSFPATLRPTEMRLTHLQKVESSGEPICHLTKLERECSRSHVNGPLSAIGFAGKPTAAYDGKSGSFAISPTDTIGSVLFLRVQLSRVGIQDLHCLADSWNSDRYRFRDLELFDALHVWTGIDIRIHDD